MRASPTLPQTADVHSSDFRLALRAVLSLRESHSVAPVPKGNCHAHDLVDRWKQLTGEPMPLHILRQELRIYLHGEAPDYRTECAQQRSADEALAVALLNEDVRLVCRSKRGRR